MGIARALVGELFVIGFDGTEVPASARSLFLDDGVAGAILFKRNIESTEQVIELNTRLFELGSERGRPLIVSVDQEGGRVARLRGICTDVPAMRAVGRAAASDPSLPYRLGASMARELSALGFHWNFAPVVDVDTNPKNPVIGERSFSRDAHVVADVAARFIEGLQGAGVAGSAKHFPGHGDTDVDSHFDLPRLPHDLERLQKVELVPFQRAVEAGVASIMTAHVMFPALDPDLPATLSPRILLALVREKLGYDGVVVSDDLEMAAVADRYSIRELVKLGLLAGVDCFLICHDNAKAHEAVEAVHALVDGKEVPRERVEQAIARVLALKAKYVGAPAAPSLADARSLLRCEPHQTLARALESYAAADADDRAASPVDMG